MSTKWTERQDGVERTTVSMSLHVPHSLVSWIAGYGQISETAALDFVVGRAADLSDHWHTVCVDDGDVEVIHTDEIKQLVEDNDIDDLQVYEGPLPTLRRTTRRSRS